MANGFYYNGNTSTLEVTGSLNTSNGGIVGSLSGIATSASYVDLVAGSNVIINQVGTAFEISASGGGGGTSADNMIVSSGSLLLRQGTTTLSTVQIYPASSSISSSRTISADTASLVTNLTASALILNERGRISNSKFLYSYNNRLTLRSLITYPVYSPAELNVYSNGANIACGRTTPQVWLTVNSAVLNDIVIGHPGNSAGLPRPGELYFSRDNTAVPNIMIERTGKVAILASDSASASNGTILFPTGVNTIFGGPSTGSWSGKDVTVYTPGFIGINRTPTSPYTLHLNTDTAAKPSTNTWTITSDSRVKTNIQPYSQSLSSINEINPVTYEYNGKAGFTASGSQIGVIAQDILPYFPECVKTYNTKLEETDENTTELYTFSSHALTFALINTIKELNTILSNQKTTLESLQNQINNL